MAALFLPGVLRLHAQAGGGEAATQRPQSLLDHDEMAQLEQAREKVFAADPALKAESDKLKEMHDSNQAPTPEQRSAAFAEWKDYQKKMRAEMLKVDPTLKPIFAKIDAARASGAASK